MGKAEGRLLGSIDGRLLGNVEGRLLGSIDGVALGDELGYDDGSTDGTSVGDEVGNREVGAHVGVAVLTDDTEHTDSYCTFPMSRGIVPTSMFDDRDK